MSLQRSVKKIKGAFYGGLCLCYSVPCLAKELSLMLLEFVHSTTFLKAGAGTLH